MRCVYLLLALIAFTPSGSAAEAAGFNGKIAEHIANERILVVNPDGTGLRYLTARTGNSNPAWAPGGRTLVFVSRRHGQENPEIYVMNADGSGQTRLTDYVSYDLEPSFSPDGSKIMFTRLVGAHTQIWVMDADGTNQGQIGTLEGHSPAWSPDGTKIAYQGFGSTSIGDIFVANADGSDPTNLTNSSEAHDAFPRWTPDGSNIVFKSGEGALVVDADGGTPTTFMWAGHPFSSLPVFSPDETAITSIVNGDAIVLREDGSWNPLVDNLFGEGGLAWQPLWVTFDPRPAKEITYGQAVTTTVRLFWGDTTDNDEVSIYRRRSGSDALAATATVDPGGNAVFELHPSRNTTYVAKWEGDSTHTGSTSDTAVVEVHVLVRTRLRGAYGTSGRYRLFHVGDGVRQTARVLPNHAGKVVHFEAQRRRADGDWVHVASIGLKLHSDSSVTAIFRTDRPGRYRTFNRFYGDRDHLRGRSAFAYFKMTR